MVTSHATQTQVGAVNAVKSDAISSHASPGSLSHEQAKVYTVDVKNTTGTSAPIPVGGDHSVLSNLTVRFDKSGSIVRHAERLISENEAGNLDITSYSTGKLAKSADTHQPCLTDAQLQKTNATPAGPDGVNPVGVEGTVACVASVLGVSGAVADLIVGARAGACTVPVVSPSICAAFIDDYAAVGGASINAVASCF